MYQIVLKNIEGDTLIHSLSSERNAPKLTSGTIKKGINSIDEFTFKINPFNAGFNLIKPYLSRIEVLNIKNNTIEFKGRALMLTPSMTSDGIIENTVICESELAYLHDTFTRYGEYHDISVEKFLKLIIDNHNSQTTNDKKFELGKVELAGNLYRFTSYEQTTFEAIKDKLLDRLGGEIIIRYQDNKRYLDYVVEVGKKSSVDIRLSKNLTSFVREVDPTQIATRAIGYGAKKENTDERVDFKNINNGKDYVDDEEAIKLYGVIEKVFVFDDVTIPENLLLKIKEKQKESNRKLVKHQISAIDLYSIGLDTETFEVGNYHRFINSVMGIDEELRIVEKVIDINDLTNSKLAIGDKLEDIKEYQLKALKNEKNITRVQETVTTTVKVVGNVNSTLNTTIDSLNDTIKILNSTNTNVSDINKALETNINATKEVASKVASLEPVVSSNTERIEKIKKRILLGVW